MDEADRTAEAVAVGYGRIFAVGSVDTTIQPKAIVHPLDSRLYHKALEVLVRQARRAGIRLRQSYLHLAKQARLKVQR